MRRELCAVWVRVRAQGRRRAFCVLFCPVWGGRNSDGIPTGVGRPGLRTVMTCRALSSGVTRRAAQKCCESAGASGTSGLGDARQSVLAQS
eukprot:5705152-Prymnesium_polylepis.1